MRTGTGARSELVGGARFVPRFSTTRKLRVSYARSRVFHGLGVNYAIYVPPIPYHNTGVTRV